MILRGLFSFVLCVVFATPALGATLYGVSPDPNGLNAGVYSVDTTTGLISLLFHTGSVWAGATDGDNATTFFATQNLNASLYRISVATNTAIPVGAHSGVNITELAYDEVHDVLYGTNDSWLYVLNKNTGAATFVGSFGIGNPALMWAMDYVSSTGELIGFDNADVSNARMYRINTTTGAATLIGPSGVGYVEDIWYDGDSGNLYGVGALPNRILQFDIATGAATVLHNTNVGISGLGKPIPEPGSLGLLLIGVAGAFGRRRGRRLHRR